MFEILDQPEPLRSPVPDRERQTRWHQSPSHPAVRYHARARRGDLPAEAHFDRWPIPAVPWVP